jgi:hypothetical protein
MFWIFLNRSDSFFIMVKFSDLYLKIIGSLVLFIGLIAILIPFRDSVFSNAFYFCYFGLVFIGLGMFFKKPLLIVSQLNILLIPLIMWNLDFFYNLILNESFLGITDYLFGARRGFLANFISSQHLYLIPFAFIGLYLIRSNFNKRVFRDSLIFSFVQLVAVFALSRVYSNYELNVNWVYYSSFNIPLPFPYVVNWFLISFFMILLSNFILRFVFGKEKKEQ